MTISLPPDRDLPPVAGPIPSPCSTEGLPHPVIELAGTTVTLMRCEEAVTHVVGRGRRDTGRRPLAVVSANLDHLHHFGHGSRWQGVLEQAQARGGVDVLALLDGMPLVHQARRLTGTTWPRLAGSDLIGPLLDHAEHAGLTLGFLGGAPQTQQRLARLLAQRRPGLEVAGWWAPERSVISDHRACSALAAQVAEAGVDLLVVGLGKPRQELWIAEHGAATGAGALLAFGAVVDFLADRVTRAPTWVSQAGLEWSFRLAQEPRRLSRRYLVDGPEAYQALRSHSRVLPEGGPATHLRRPGRALAQHEAEARVATRGPRAEELGHRTREVDLTAVLVTYNNGADVDRVLDDLHRSADGLTLRVLAVDNGSTDGTRELLTRRDDVTLLVAPGNLGYAGGINHALESMDPSRAVLVLNPDLALDAEAVPALWRRLCQPGVGAVAPRLVGPDGAVRRSLRFEPTVTRTWGDALLGDRAGRRPTWSTETDHDPESYCHPHPVDWATGACLMVRGEVVEEVGAWDERYFLYSEEVDYLRRVRALGWSVWFEPAAVVRHDEGGSGRNPALAALQAVNRVRYCEAVHGRGAAAVAVRAAVLTGSLARLARGPEHRAVAHHLLSRRRWHDLPRAEITTLTPPVPTPRTAPWGCVVVPAHQEQAVIGDTLAPLVDLVAQGLVELVVAANGCTDATVELAGRVEGARVLDLPASSKTTALNHADAVATCWPRLYLDADITLTPRTLAALFLAFEDGAVLAARPSARYDVSGSAWLVRRYYAARERLPECRAHLWGAGAYALSRAGHERVGPFPGLTADDLYVDASFAPSEKRIVPTDPVVVRAPCDVANLLKVLRRNHGGVDELNAAARGGRAAVPAGSTTRRTLGELARSVRSPGSLLDACVYAGLTAVARVQTRRRGLVTWERDDSSRRPTGR